MTSKHILENISETSKNSYMHMCGLACVGRWADGRTQQHTQLQRHPTMHQFSQYLVANKIYRIRKIIISSPVVAAMGQQHSMQLRAGQTHFKHSRLSHWINPITDGPSSSQLLVCLGCLMITHNTQSERSPNAFNPQLHLGQQTLLLLSTALMDPTPAT